MYNPVLRESPDPPPIRRPRSSVWESPVHRDDSDSLAGLVFVSRNFTMCPEQIGVAPLSRSLASRTLVMPRSCLVNNCLIFSLPPSLAPSLPLPSYVLIHSFTSRCLEIPAGSGFMKGLKTVVTVLVLRAINATRASQKEVAGIIVEIDGARWHA